MLDYSKEKLDKMGNGNHHVKSGSTASVWQTLIITRLKLTKSLLSKGIEEKHDYKIIFTGELRLMWSMPLSTSESFIMSANGILIQFATTDIVAILKCICTRKFQRFSFFCPQWQFARKRMLQWTWPTTGWWSFIKWPLPVLQRTSSQQAHGESALIATSSIKWCWLCHDFYFTSVCWQLSVLTQQG